MALSGAASLIYEIVWLRMLSRAFGVTIHAVSFLIALYFGGLVLGALAASRWTRRETDWLGVYALLETAGAAAALLATLWMSALPRIVAAISPLDAGLGPAADTLIIFVLAGPALLLPTFFFGATLPVLCRHGITRIDELRRGAGALYGANTLGAMLGVIAASFWTIAYWGETASALTAAAGNLTAATAAFSMSGRKLPWRFLRPPTPHRLSLPVISTPSAACLLFMLSGFCAMGYEVLWTRRLILLLGTSGYAFGFLLICYLGGTALGSALAARRNTSERGAWELFGRLELLLAAAALLSLWLCDWLGLRQTAAEYLYTPLVSRQDLPRLALHAAMIVLPASIVMGLLFPLAARLESSGDDTAGTTIGRVYAFNTAGGILGSLVIGFWGIGRFGTHKSFLILAALNAGIGAAALLRHKPSLLRPASMALAVLVLFAGFAARRDRSLDIIMRRLERMKGEMPRVMFHDEAPAGTATGVASADESTLLINGIIISGTGINGALMTSIPNVFREDPRRTLLIGVGAGTTLVAASLLGGEVHAAELLQPVADRIGMFQPGRRPIYERPQTRIFMMDGRNLLLRSRKPYDLVLVDGSPPLFAAGTTNLYTVDFMRLVRQRLTRQGIFTLWLPLPSFEDDYWDILKGMYEVFPHVAVWSHPDIRAGVMYFGSQEPLSWAPGVLERRLKERVQPRILTSLTEEKVREGFRITPAEARAYVRPYRLVTDDRPITEYPLGKLLRGQTFRTDNSFLLQARGAR
ncbi:MAG: fused MFS/spermidine synthase [Elusimicrobiota bacterium]